MMLAARRGLESKGPSYGPQIILLMIEILHDLTDPKLWE